MLRRKAKAIIDSGQERLTNYEAASMYKIDLARERRIN
jgi:hypothetical protein